MPKVLRKLLANRPLIYFGLDSFIDKPLNRARSSSYIIYDYQLVYSLQENYNGMQLSIQTISPTGNNDCPEASLTALVQGLCKSNGWRDKSLKLAVTITDACPKSFDLIQDCQDWGGSLSCCKNYYLTDCNWTKHVVPNYPNNYDCYDNCYYGYPSTSRNSGSRDGYDDSLCKFPNSKSYPDTCWYFGSGEDYPSRAGVAAYLAKRNIFPVYAIGTGDCNDFNWISTKCVFYNDAKLSTCWNSVAKLSGATVQRLTSDGTGVVEAIESGIQYLTSTLKMYELVDAYDYVNNKTGINPTNFTNVVELSTYTFRVTLYTSKTVVNNTIELSVQGWGSAYIVVWSSYPCYGCDHVPNSGKVLDKCNKCGGTNACVDCNGEPYGIAEQDQCNVCAGNNDCRDCAGNIPATLKVDGCGVCGGDGRSCLKYDICGVFNGSNACLDCAFNLWGNMTMDKCGVCGGKNECGGCDVTFTLAYDDCGVCGGNNSCYDCKGEMWKNRTLDICGVCGGDGSTCRGCDNRSSVNPATYDVCGSCGGNGTWCIGCDGQPYGKKVACGVCGGDNKTCIDCAGVEYGDNFYDRCGVCLSSSSLNIDACYDCNGKAWGTAKYDACLVCGGKNECLGCDGAGGSYDECGLCAGDGSTCVSDCQGTVDLCGICNGTNACAGCDLSKPFQQVYDSCGVCIAASDPNYNWCIGCDNVPFSGAVYDRCDVCDGLDSCVGCDNVPHSGTVYDSCGVCDGDNDCLCDGVMWVVRDNCYICGGNNTACIGCDNVPNSAAEYDLCGVCNGNDTCVGGCFNIPWGQNTPNECGVCGAGSEVRGCDNVCFSGAGYDDCGVCNGANACFDCVGKWHTPHYEYDACWECGGNNKSCLGCDGVVNSGKSYDDCGVCGGTNDCYGCDNVVWSGMHWDDCGICSSTKTNACAGCDGVAMSGKTYDRCGICGGSDVCVGCDGVAYSGKAYDKCKVCGGSNKCVGCDGVAYSAKRYDQCGVCAGTGLTCVGCDLVLWSTASLDSCGVCKGHNECVGCDGANYSYKRYDACGVCGGNRSCLGCDAVPYSGKEKDVCGKCGGNETDKSKCSKKFTATPLIALGVVIGASLVLVGLIIASIFLYKRLHDGKDWYIPNALLTDAGSGAVDNPIFMENEENQFHDNPNFQDAAD
eukprot:TRINITY_DN440_c0_g2_i1.p1 TRINITY_DN440_c0_g2~~TRINITY_DN440_c0_g2_i1.p1  ORF type:complete len:1301 (-),score=331.62 TRINITY_DN440_c0_g2_i1:88-3549(-)